MRTTVNLDDDASQAVRRLREETGMDVSEAVNELTRRGLLPRPEAGPFRQRTRPLGLRVDVSDVAVVLEGLDGVS